MVSDIYSARLYIGNYIRDLLTDLAVDGESGIDIDEIRDNFARVSDLILDELGLEVKDFVDGVAHIEVSPLNGWS